MHGRGRCTTLNDIHLIGNTIDGRWARDDTSELDPALAAAMEGMEPLSAPESESGGAYQ